MFAIYSQEPDFGDGKGPTRSLVTVSKDREFWDKSNSDKPRWMPAYIIEEVPEATDEESAQVEEINTWLIEHYNEGAHWVYETTDTMEHVLKLRELGMDEYRKDLKDRWETIHEYAEDIRNS